MIDKQENYNKIIIKIIKYLELHDIETNGIKTTGHF